MVDFNSLRATLALDDLSLQGDSLGNLTSNYLEQMSRLLQDVTQDNNSELGRVPRKYIAALQQYIELEYLYDQKKTLDELLVGCNVEKKPFLAYRNALLISPYRSLFSRGDTDFCSIFSILSGTVHAINKTQVIDLVGKCEEGIFRFILDVCGLTKLDYSFESFRDPDLETLYSNDGITFKQKDVTCFFRFFIDGDADKGKVYSPDSYYGSIPVSENRVRSFCKKKEIATEYTEKLLAIVNCSSRFDVTKEGEDIKYALKLQYLNNCYAMSVAILFNEGRPLHKEVLKARIDKLHNQFPSLVDSYAIESFVIRRKPILCAAGAQGEWGLRIWKTNVHILDAIRSFVSQKYSEEKRPVTLDEIYSAMRELGYTYDKKTIQTYVTKAGCKAMRKGLYLPPAAEESGDTRYWIGKMYLLQRYAARFLLTSGRSASRKEIREFIGHESSQDVNAQTLNRALLERPDLFSVTGNGKRNQRIVLSDVIAAVRDVNRVIPEPEKKELDYIKDVRNKTIDYLFEKKEVLQQNLTGIFIQYVPEYLKARDAVLRRILSDKDYFCKQESSDGTVVSLNPNYRARLEIERQEEEKISAEPTPVIPFSWSVLKEGIMRQLLKDEVDKGLSEALEKVFYIFRCGNDEMPLNSSFNTTVKELFKYITAPTTPEERRGLQKEILVIMEAFLREFYFLKYGDSLQAVQGLGQLKYYFRKEGLFPDKEKSYLSPYELSMYRIIDSINTQRNRIVGHPGALTEQSDKQSVKDIHDCLALMVYLGKLF